MLGVWLVQGAARPRRRVVVLKRDECRGRRCSSRAPRRAAPSSTATSPRRARRRAIGEYEVDTVFHLAAQTIVGTANRSPLSTFESNMRGTWLLLEACRHHGRGAHGRRRVRQGLRAQRRAALHRGASALQPLYPYDVSKAWTDLITRSYWHTYGLPVAVTRFANIYGGGDPNPSRLVPEAVSAALAGRRPVIRSDGTPERDLPLRGGRGRRPTWRSAARSTTTAGVRGEAFNAGGGPP